MTASMTRPELIATLTGQGWTVEYGHPWSTGDVYMSADKDLLLEMESERMCAAGITDWTLSRFTDSDIDGVATGRYRTIDEGESLADVLEAVRCAAMGIPRDVDEDKCPDCEMTGTHSEGCWLSRDLGPEVDDGGVEDIERENDRRIL